MMRSNKLDKIRRLLEKGFTEEQIHIILEEDGLDEKTIINLINEVKRIEEEQREVKKREELLEKSMEVDPEKLHISLGPEVPQVPEAMIRRIVREELESFLESRSLDESMVRKIAKEEVAELWNTKIKPLLTKITKKIGED